MLFDRPCARCQGEGTVWTSRYGGNDPDVWSKTCPACEGSGVETIDLNEEIDESDDE